MADVCCYPQSDRWLQTLAQHCMNGRELVVGYTRYEDGTPDYRVFERYYEARYIMREYQHDHAYRCPFNALMFRKDLSYGKKDSEETLSIFVESLISWSTNMQKVTT